MENPENILRYPQFGKEYHSKYYQDHKDIWTKKETCKICNVEYNRMNRTNHKRTRLHQLNSEIYILKYYKDK